MATRIQTGRKFIATGNPVFYEVLQKKGEIWHVIEPERGLKGHYLVRDGIVYAPNIQAGQYYPTKFWVEEDEMAQKADPDLLSSLNLGPGEETTEEMLEEFRQELREHCPRCGLPIHPEQEFEAGLCPGCGARHE